MSAGWPTPTAQWANAAALHALHDVRREHKREALLLLADAAHRRVSAMDAAALAVPLPASPLPSAVAPSA